MKQRTQVAHECEPTKTMALIPVSGSADPTASMDPMGTPRINDPDASELPNAADTPPPPDALAAFVQVIEAARYPSPRIPRWWLASAMQKFNDLCAYCGQDAGSAPTVDAMIPVVAGGPHRLDAAVLTCKRCRLARRRRDLLLWKPGASPKLRAMRAALALDSWNHLSRDPSAMKTPAKAADVITARWQHPRFHCHGALLSTGGFIGWRDATQVPSAMQLRLAFDHNAWRLRQSVKNTHRRNNTPAVFWLPTQQRALDALWDVIEHNGLVRHASLGTSPSPMEETQPGVMSDWARVFPTVADLVRRRWRQQR